MSTRTSTFVPGVFFVLLGLVVVNILFAMMPPEVTLRFIQESGMVELLSAAGYFVAAALLVILAVQKEVASGYSTGFLVLLLGLRELDFHDRFTTMGIFKTKFYVSSIVPLGEKILVSILMICLVSFIIWYLKKHAASFFSELKYGTAHAVLTGCGIACMFFSKFMDSYSELLQNVLILVNEDPGFQARIIEETLELAIPVFFLLAILHVRKTAK